MLLIFMSTLTLVATPTVQKVYCSIVYIKRTTSVIRRSRDQYNEVLFVTQTCSGRYNLTPTSDVIVHYHIRVDTVRTTVSS